MVSITFYDNSINVLDNPCQKHLKRNQVMEKQQFSPKKDSNNSVTSTTKYTATSCFWDCDDFY